MLLGSATRDELLTRITRELQRLVPYDFLTIYEVDSLHRQFLPLHVVDRFERHLEDAPFPMGAGIFAMAAREWLMRFFHSSFFISGTGKTLFGAGKFNS